MRSPTVIEPDKARYKNVRIGRVVSGGGQQIEQSARNRTLHRETPVFRVEAVEKAARALSKMIAQSEDLHFLRAAVARPEHAEIVEFTALRRPAIQQRVGKHRKARFAQERRDHRRDQQQQE